MPEVFFDGGPRGRILVADSLTHLAAGGVAPGDVAVGAPSAGARVGHALGTCEDGVVSAVNSRAARKGVRVGTAARDAARLMLEQAARAGPPRTQGCCR